jgi:amino acid adenylation domain-containing protein
MAVSRDELSEAKRTLLEQRLRGERAATAGPDPVSRRRHSQPPPLSVSQEQLWYFTRLAPENPVYNEVVTIRKDGPLDVHALRAAVTELLRRHEIWRSSFPATDQGPVQLVHPAPAALDLPLVDLSHLAGAEAEHRAVQIAAEQARRPYDVERGPLLRPVLMSFSADHHRLYLAMHHLVFDGVTINRVVLPELVALYDAFAAGEASPLPEPALQYADYADWEREWIASPVVARRIAWWREHLAGAPTLALPLDRPRPSRQRFVGNMEPVTISVAVAHGLRALSRETGSTLFQVVAASFSLLLQRYSDEDDVVFGTVSNLRQRPDVESLVGYCVTPLVVRCDLHGDPSFTELVHRMRDELLNGLDRIVPFERLVRELQPARDARTNPVFQSMLVLEPPMRSPDPDWSVHLMDSALGSAVGNAKFDLDLELDERPDGHLAGRLVYNTDLFDAETARRMIGHWYQLVAGAVADPGRPISEFALCTGPERRQQILDWAATRVDYPQDACVPDLVSAQARDRPDAVAVVFGTERLTYRELDRRSDGAALLLRQAGMGRGAVVAMFAERSVDLLVGILAVLKTGAAYVPLDPRHPADRLAFLLADSAATMVLTQRPLEHALPAQRPQTLYLDDLPAPAGEGVATAPQPRTSPDDLAYILYTSGSTGRPKGVRVQHANVVNLMAAMALEPGLCSDDVVLSSSSFSFDMSVGDVFPTLGAGARIVLASREEVADPRLLAELVESSGATVMHATPAMWQALVATGWRGNPHLVAVTGGEPLSEALADALLDRCVAVWNGYGPTETTVYATFWRVERNTVIAIGRPAANRRLYVLDRHQQPVPVGVPGEIFISGRGVAAGYVNRPDETAQRFLPDPFFTGDRMYRTGDQARQLADGRLQHLGRLDNQVKVRGIRIEPGEIEAALVAQPGISAAVVVLREDTPADRRLVAYVVGTADVGNSTEPAIAELRAALRQTLPEQLVPSAFVRLDAIPVTANGKVDRSALPPPASESADARSASDVPRSGLEQRLARIWADTLNVDRVGRQDNFFDIGGHSLLAVRMMTAVERDLGIELPLVALFEAGATVAGLATAVEARQADGESGEAAQPPPSGDRPLVFIVHPNEPSMFTLRHFTGPLGADMHAVGLLPHRIDRQFRRAGSIEQLATPLLSEVRAAQPHGPYYLAGYSLGALLAYELAGQLRAAGEEVRWICILDVGTPERTGPVVTLGARLRRQRGIGWAAACRKGLAHLRSGIDGLLVGVRLRRSRRWSDDFDFRAAWMLAARYRCDGHDAPMTVFVTRDSERVYGSDSLGWRDLHQGALTVRRAPGDHLTMLQQPHVGRLAADLSDSLRRARGSGVTRQ